MRGIYLLLFVPTVAWAQSSAPISPPASVGKAHICLEYYPAVSVRLGEQGKTTLSFHITEEGTVSKLVVAQSSGSEALDKAALICAATWLYKPAMQDGKPVEVPWKAEVRWLLSSGDRQWDFSIERTSCGQAPPPAAAQWENVRGPTVLTVTLAQGKFVGATLKTSSGSAEFDALANRCFDGITFIGADGQPKSAVETVAVEWIKPAQK